MSDRMEDRSARQRRRTKEQIEYDAKMAQLQQQIDMQTGFASSNPNNLYPEADATYGSYGGAQQGLTSRDGPSRNPDVGERLSWLARNSRMPTKEQFDLSLLDPRTRRDAAAVVRAKQNP